jgi:glutathione S-transferase
MRDDHESPDTTESISTLLPDPSHRDGARQKPNVKEATMLKLGGFAFSNYYNKAKVALLEKGIPFEEAFCMTSQDEAYLKRSPMGKVPYLEIDGQFLCESQVICEYLEDRYPEKPLYPKDLLERARVRELMVVMELHMELVARRLYTQAFFGGTVSDEIKKQVEKDLAKGVRAFKQLAKFSPYVAGASLTYADCAAAVHLPLISLSTKIVFGRDVFDDYAPVKPYLKMLNERPAFRKMNDERKVATEGMAAQRAKKS